MPVDPKHMKAIFDTLKASVQSGLNASLTPEDCAELLRMFTAINMRNTIQTAPAPRSSRPSPVEKIVEGVADIAHGVIEDLAGDLTPRRRTARSRRRKP